MFYRYNNISRAFNVHCISTVFLKVSGDCQRYESGDEDNFSQVR